MKLKASTDNVSLLCFVFILDFGAPILGNLMNKRFHCTEPLMAVRSQCFHSVLDFQSLCTRVGTFKKKKKKEYMYVSMAAVIDLVSGLFP